MTLEVLIPTIKFTSRAPNSRRTPAPASDIRSTDSSVESVSKKEIIK